VNDSLAGFDTASSARVLDAVCDYAGLDPTGARLLRHHTNAVYRLAQQPVIVKISRPGASLHRLRRSVRLAEYLADVKVPAVCPWPELEQPVTVDQRHATLWVAVDGLRPARAEDLAEPLRLLHAATGPQNLDFPAFDPFAAVASSLTRPNMLDSDELSFLAAHAATLRADYAALSFDQPQTVIHGDAHHSNCIVSPTGSVLADLESACLGPAEWDLVTVAVHCQRFGHPPEEYRAFTARYGRDVEDWPGVRTLAAVRELRMITTNAWKSAPGTSAAEEVHRRISELRAGSRSRIWQLL
jgi:Ser/Thr protein kinase RdoA (MazF antagonist)